MMNNKLFIPACHKFITKKTELQIFKEYTAFLNPLIPQNIQTTHYLPKKYSIFKLNQIIPRDFSIQDMDFDYQELCFSIITQYKCNSICQLCPYSSLYKNIYEDEEAILLSYALSSWERLNSLKKLV